jgi:hypothetical protein
MTARATAIAHALIEQELSRIPEADRGKVADQVLGALTSYFMLLPHRPDADETATRADLAGMGIAGLAGRGAAS